MVYTFIYIVGMIRFIRWFSIIFHQLTLECNRFFHICGKITSRSITFTFNYQSNILYVARRDWYFQYSQRYSMEIVFEINHVYLDKWKVSLAFIKWTTFSISFLFFFNHAPLKFITIERDKILLKYILISLDFPLNSITSLHSRCHDGLVLQRRKYAKYFLAGNSEKERFRINDFVSLLRITAPWQLSAK